MKHRLYTRHHHVFWHITRANGDFLDNIDEIPWTWSPRNAIAFTSYEAARRIVRRMYGSPGVRVVRA